MTHTLSDRRQPRRKPSLLRNRAVVLIKWNRMAATCDTNLRSCRKHRMLKDFPLHQWKQFQMNQLATVHTPYVSTVSRRVVAKFNKNVISLVDIWDTARTQLKFSSSPHAFSKECGSASKGFPPMRTLKLFNSTPTWSLAMTLWFSSCTRPKTMFHRLKVLHIIIGVYHQLTS